MNRDEPSSTESLRDHGERLGSRSVETGLEKLRRALTRNPLSCPAAQTSFMHRGEYCTMHLMRQTHPTLWTAKRASVSASVGGSVTYNAQCSAPASTARTPNSNASQMPSVDHAKCALLPRLEAANRGSPTAQMVGLTGCCDKQCKSAHGRVGHGEISPVSNHRVCDLCINHRTRREQFMEPAASVALSVPTFARMRGIDQYIHGYM